MKGILFSRTFLQVNLFFFVFSLGVCLHGKTPIVMGNIEASPETKKTTARIIEDNLNVVTPTMYPNPIVNQSVLNVKHSHYNGLSVSFYTVAGKKSHQTTISQENTEIYRTDFQVGGLYYYEILENEERVLGRGEFLVR